MKKVGIAIILLAAVVGIGYLNAVRDEAKSKQLLQEGFDRGAKEAQSANHRADSITALLVSSQRAYSDSLKASRTRSEADRDSILQLVDQKDQELTSLKEKAKTSRLQQTTHKADLSAATIKHTQILDFYRRKLSGLPRDLSDAERKLAVTEIKEETAKKFSLTQEDLEKIRQDAHLAD